MTNYYSKYLKYKKKYLMAKSNMWGGMIDDEEPAPLVHRPGEGVGPSVFPKKVYFCSYDGNLTGSTELRNLNDLKIRHDDSYKEDNDLAKYCNNYDNPRPPGKGNEPYFDAYLSYIALSQDKSIHYHKMEFKDYPNDNEVAPNSQFRTNVSLKPNLSRDIAFNGNYNNAYHIFILAPLSPASLNDILAEIKQSLEKNRDIVIHMQGEAVNSESNIDREKYGSCQEICHRMSGMTPYGDGKGMFGEAFNLCSGSNQASELRNYIKELVDKGKAELYSVQIHAKEDTEDVPTTKGNIKIPRILSDATNYILKMIGSFPKLVEHTNAVSLKIGYICQDITDKDNLTSLICLSTYTSITTKLRLIGFRLYKSLSIPLSNFSHNTLNFASKEWGQNEILNEFFKPSDVRDNAGFGNICFLHYRTIVFNKKAQEGFMNVLMQNPFSQEKYKIVPWDEGCIVDGVELESRSGKSPMNMSLYYFAPDSYMMDALNEIGGISVLVGNFNKDCFITNADADQKGDFMDIKGVNGLKVNIQGIFGTKKIPSNSELINQCHGIEKVKESLKDYAEALKQEDSDWYEQFSLKKVRDSAWMVSQGH